MPPSNGRVRITGPRSDDADRQQLSVPLDPFARQAAEEESVRLGVSIEELVEFAVLYYLADVDSGRVARQIRASPFGDAGR